MAQWRMQRPITAIVLPSLSPTMTNGVVADWKKKPGDLLRPGDILCDIDTDKASVGFEVWNSLYPNRVHCSHFHVFADAR
jgi:hypothetical protein